MTPCWKSHRGVSVFTFVRLICVIGEKRDPARSRLWSAQFTVAGFCACAASGGGARAKKTWTASAVTMPRPIVNRCGFMTRSIRSGARQVVHDVVGEAGKAVQLALEDALLIAVRAVPLRAV